MRPRLMALTATLIALAAAGALVLPASAVPGQPSQVSSNCFGHSGVQEGSHNAYECSWKDHDEDGTLYWQVNNTDLEWNLHSDSGQYVVNAITTLASPGMLASPSFVAFIEDGPAHGGGCKVVGAGYGRHSTMCQPGNGHIYLPPRPMTAIEQASWDDFAEVMAEGVPDSAWSR